jgi:hypothetical protein
VTAEPATTVRLTRCRRWVAVWKNLNRATFDFLFA